MVIKESFFLTADDTDILAAPSRLAAIPHDGIMTIEAGATHNDGTNYGTLTLQLPDGEVPFEDLLVPYNGYSATDGLLHESTELLVSFDVAAGGHVGLAYDETGTVAACFIIVTLTF